MIHLKTYDITFYQDTIKVILSIDIFGACGYQKEPVYYLAERIAWKKERNVLKNGNEGIA